MQYKIIINVDYLNQKVTVECDHIHFASQSRLQSDTISHVLSTPVKLITSEIKALLKDEQLPLPVDTLPIMEFLNGEPAQTD